MKKSIVLWILLVMGIVSSAAQEKTKLKMSGVVNNTNQGKVYLQKFDNKMFYTVDSVKIENGKFNFSTNIQLPELYGLSLDTTRGQFYVFLDKDPVVVTLDSASYYAKSVMTGSKLQDLFTDYKQRENIEIDQFIKENPSSLVSAYVLYRDFSYRLSPEQIKSNVALLDPSLKNTPYVKVLDELVGVLETVSIGKKAPDVFANDPDGNILHLSEYIGKGYLLVDFWASWCGPCRRENPNVVKAFQKYKDKGFNIFAVSLDKSGDRWKNAIQADQLDWVHVSDLKFWNSEPAKVYGVRAIPSNFLIDPQGNIVGKNLMGEDLDKMLGEFLGK